MARNTEPEIELDDIDDNDPDALRQVREYAKRQGQKAKLADHLSRENAALKAGIDTSTRLGQAWLTDYKGALDDPAAMLADAKDFSPNIVRGAVASEGEGTTETSTQSGETGTQVSTEAPSTGSAERSALVNGAVASGVAEEDVRGASMRQAREALEKGAGEDEAAGSMIASLARGAMEGKIQVLDSRGNPTRL